MVAIIGHSKNIRAVLTYNEQKVKKGSAELICSNKFACDPAVLSFSARLNRFEKLNERNTRTKTNTLHISLNFDPIEQLSNATLSEIANMYMAGIGFDQQPYLVYRHHDAAHPHIHLVTTLISADGTRINTHNLGRLKSEPSRKAIEKQFGLVAAGSKKQVADTALASEARAAVYAKSPTRPTIDSIVSYVVRNYRFTTLPELNAALALFNVRAETGKEQSYLAKTGGIQYHLLDDRQKPVGVPIKGSALTGRPTLNKLQRLYKINEVLRKKHKTGLVDSLSKTVAVVQSISPDQLKLLLGKWNIGVHYHFNKEGRLFGITYIDHSTRCVFKGSDLGKAFSANAVFEKFDLHKSHAGKTQLKPWFQQQEPANATGSLLATLMEPGLNATALPYELSLKKGKNKRKRRPKL